jgi:hypothetical protein
MSYDILREYIDTRSLIYSVRLLSEFLEGIPDYRWITEDLSDREPLDECTNCCAEGHIRYASKVHGVSIERQMKLNEALMILRESIINTSIVTANDGFGGAWPHVGSTPKERVLNFLENVQLAAEKRDLK